MRVPEFNVATASEFIARLRPSSSEWGSLSEPALNWVFRGHGDARWQLLPSAQRANSVLNPIQFGPWLQSMFDRAKNKGENSLISAELAAHHLAEAKILLQFNNLCDDVGFPRLQSSANRINPRIVEAINGDEAFEWKPSILHAVAQHHGVPTRLLDWSHDPLVSIYFAARDSVRLGLHKEQEAKIALWAFDSWAIPMFRGISRTFEVDNIYSDFIHAQRGIFTWLDADGYFVESGSWMTFDEAILRDLAHENSIGHDDLSPSKWASYTPIEPEAVIRKYLLPATEAVDLIKILRRERRTLAYLMPTLDNIAASIIDEWLE